MGTREVLSLQFGHYSNFIGTHWWNIQETSFEYNSNKPSDINNDVLFREGLTDKGEVTYTPRLLLVDLKGSLGSLPERGNLYEPPVDPTKAETHWKNVQTETSEPTPKNTFQEELATTKNPCDVLKKSFDLSSDVKVWSDFLYSQFHPRTVNTVSQYSHTENSNFSAFTQGSELWGTEQFTETFSDKIRNYVEECDHFQGFHVTFDSVNGFSGLTSSCIKYIVEEYEKKPILAFPVVPSYYSVDESSTTNTARCLDSLRIVNLALCYDALNEYCSLFVPLCTSTTGWRQPGPKQVFNLVSYNRSLYYHTSAILAAAMDTFTLKYRAKSSYHTVNDLCTYFNSNGRKAAAASVCLPFAINESSYLIDCLDNWDGPLTKSITPSCSIGTDNLVQIFTLRGIPENRLKQPISENQPNLNISAQKCKTVNEMLTFYLSCNYFFSLSTVVNAPSGMSVRTPYPPIFDKSVGNNGILTGSSKKKSLDTIPILSGLHSGTCIGDMIDSLHKETKRIKRPELNQFVKTGLEMQEMSDCFERLLEFSECYSDNYI